jgi:hypothetical protein
LVAGESEKYWKRNFYYSPKSSQIYKDKQIETEGYQGKASMIAKDLNREPAGRRLKQPWQTPELQEADFDMTQLFTGDDNDGKNKS